MKFLLYIILFLSLILALEAQELSQAEAWSLYTSQASLYEGGRIDELSRSGKSSGQLKSLAAAKITDHALLVQKISSENYRGKRLRLSASLKTQNVAGWAGIWVRVDDPKGRVLSFENMAKQAVRGSTDWAEYTLNVDVPNSAFEIHFGALLAGSGTVYVDDFKLRATGGTRPGAELKQRIRSLPTEPQNVGFEKRKIDE